MNYKYRTGLVVGKFMPLHKGHEYLIQTAFDSCEQVIILNYSSIEDERFNPDMRRKYLRSFTSYWSINDRAKIHVFDNCDCPADDAPEEVHQKFCADYLFDELHTTVQAVFGSEEYINGFADYLTLYFTSKLLSPLVVHPVIVDIVRNKYLISGTELRDPKCDVNTFNQMVSPYITRHFRKKFLFLGGESTGKTTIISELSDILNIDACFEYGRDYYDYTNKKLYLEDMEHIALSQWEREDRSWSVCNAHKPLLCDTSPLTTLFYSLKWFGRASPTLHGMAATIVSRYSKIFVCAPDFPLVQDGTRQDEAFRQAGHEFYIKTLTKNKIPFKLLTGTEKNRIKDAIKYMKE